MDQAAALALALDPSLTLELTGIDPDPWQRRLLRSRSDKILVCCHRQNGKSTAAAALGIFTALDEPGALVLIVSASLRQSGELFRKVGTAYKALGTPVPLVEDSATTLALATGSRVVSLPDSPDTIVGYSGPRLIIIDEAARTSDETFKCLRPMLLASHGRIVALSTPHGQRGWFYEQWHDATIDWERIEFKASQNPRADPVWLAEERRILGPLWYSQEYELTFIATDNQMFSTEAINAAFRSDVEPLFAGSEDFS
jgi:hypothetical protein